MEMTTGTLVGSKTFTGKPLVSTYSIRFWISILIAISAGEASSSSTCALCDEEDN